MTAEPTFASQYDLLVLDPFMRQYFGPAGYFNAGYWLASTNSQEQACSALTERLIGFLPEDCERILDVGCGLGATTSELSNLRPESKILALNISRRQLAACGRACPGADLVQSDATCIALAAGSVDAILSVEAAFHFRTRQMFFAEARRILRPGGRLALSDILFKPAPWPGAWTVPAENSVEGPDEYEQLLRGAGFGQIEIEDATEPCWGGFCSSLERWLPKEATGSEPGESLAQSLADAVQHYLLVSAVRTD